MATNRRAVVVGASTLLGKELVEELNTSSAGWDLRLAETSDAGGQLVAGGDEALVVQPLTPDIFEGREVAFFAAEPEITRAHWREARDAGAVVMDVFAALEDEAEAAVRSPWIANGRAPKVDAAVVIPAHPAALMLGVVASRLGAALGRVHLAATILEPASQQGSGGLDEMHQQTVGLLGFHSLPQEVYDGQVAFNLRVGFGESAKADMGKISATIRRHLSAIGGEAMGSAVSFQLVQAPVFHAYTMSVYVQVSAKAEAMAVRQALQGGVVHVVRANEDAPTNQSVVEEEGIAIAVSEDASSAGEVRGFWLWMAADNLKLAARHAVACAEEVAAVRGAKPQ